ncbi:hypothetical protein [Georgenia alba]|uniref:Sulfotransferase family protein n=1 Tax=Georgenia alba TaxID=2233858 RepID=A0ABW2Q9C0_9MICO
MTTAPPEPWLEGYEQGKHDGARFGDELGPLRPGRGARPLLREALAELMIRDGRGEWVTDEERAELRRLAAGSRQHDWDEMAVTAMAFLAGRFGDSGARAWLAPMLAHAGRYEEAAATSFTWSDGRPAAPDFVVIVSALALLGREDEARARMAGLESRFTNLGKDFVTRWHETDLGRQFDALAAKRPSDGKLPVFFHLPFSGGTSMIVSLKQAVPRAAILEINRRFGLHQIERALDLDADRVARLRLIHQHHPFAMRLPGRDLTYFTVLRDPVSQLSSGYHKRLASKGIVPTRDRSATFEEHAEHTMTNGLTNMLARQIVTTHPDMLERYERHFDRAGAFRTIRVEEDMYWFEATRDLGPDRLLEMSREALDLRFHVVGSMKHLAASHLAGAASVGVPVARRIVHRGKSGRPQGTESDVERRLRDANWVDQTLYEEYTERFERDYADLVRTVDEAAALDAATG